MRISKTIVASGLAVAVSLMLSGCGTGGQTADSAPTGGQQINVVTSTNVYGSIAEAIGGNKVNVTSIINKVSQDPHSYEATAQNKLAMSKAAVTIENGGGYDDFFDQLASGTKAANHAINVVDLSGLEATAPKDSFNEHVWYNLPTIKKLASTLAGKLGEIDPGNAAVFTANAEKFAASLDQLQTSLDAIKKTHDGDPVAITEPVPLYMLQSAGLVNKTPQAYSHAIEEGTDVPATVLKEATDQLTNKEVKLLAYNSQTEGPQTEALKKAADGAQVPVVDFTETLPDGQDYVSWMRTNVSAIASALGS